MRRKLLLGGPIGLLIASLGGYALASAALRPVERMRRTAATISGHTHNQRLPIGRAQDEISRLAHTLNEMLDRVDQAIEREHRFVTDASHELRTPLALLKTELEIALRHANNASELRAALSSASDEADRLNQLAESLLLLARADNGKLPLTASTIDPASLLRTVALRYERRADECNRRITTSSAIDHPISADGQLLEHALGNLVENALHHGSGTVALRALESTDALEVHCRDQGRGFDPAIAATAFERFARADDARAKAGSGLGLAIVAAIAATHGGSAHLENGAHTDVWIRLPLHPPPTTRHARQPHPRPGVDRR